MAMLMRTLTTLAAVYAAIWSPQFPLVVGSQFFWTGVQTKKPMGMVMISHAACAMMMAQVQYCLTLGGGWLAGPHHGLGGWPERRIFRAVP